LHLSPSGVIFQLWIEWVDRKPTMNELEDSSASLIIECFEPESGLLTQTLPGRIVELSQG
jgi:hypothetical protein